MRKILFVQKYGRSSFFDCTSLEKFIGGTAIKTFGLTAFNNAYNISEFEFSDTNETFPENFLISTKIKTAKVGPNVTVMPLQMLGYIKTLETLYISNSVTEFGTAVIHSCTALKDIYYDGTLEEWKAIIKATNWANNVPTTCVVHFSDGTTNTLGNVKS